MAVETRHKRDKLPSKTGKIYLRYPNLTWLFSENKPYTGNLRETFFFSQLEVSYCMTYSKFGDFSLNDTYTFEIGEPSKTPG